MRLIGREIRWQKRGTERNALLMGAPIMSRTKREERALGMGQRRRNAAMKDAQTMFRREECVEGTGQRSNDAAVKGVQTML